MDRPDIAQFLRENLRVQVKRDSNWDGCYLEIKLYLGREEISRDFVSVNYLESTRED